MERGSCVVAQHRSSRSQSDCSSRLSYTSEVRRKCDNLQIICCLNRFLASDDQDMNDTINTKGTSHSDDRIKRAKISFVVDVVLACATFGFLYMWVATTIGHRQASSSFHNENKYFSPYFIEHGFCNSTPDHFHTQRNCAYLDWTVSILSLTFISMKRRHRNHHPTNILQMLGHGVVYPFVHGTAHWMVSKGWIDPQQEINQLTQIMFLAAILAIGPAAVVSELRFKNQHNPIILGTIFVVLDGSLVWFFIRHIKSGVMVLLYINVVTNLILFCTRIILFNPFTSPTSSTADDKKDAQKAVEYRNAFFGPKYFYQSLMTMILMVVVMLIEPTQCGSNYPPMMGWFAKLGGHWWFDVSLSFISSVYLLNALSEPAEVKKDTSIPTRQFFFY
mmetsp:Transcript_7132/g.17457  ORF Transcript_7132/g.17457 Transcript_7132/m.17457 type:complete len:390 (-) Transcript_7132:46-1215(-)